MTGAPTLEAPAPPAPPGLGGVSAGSWAAGGLPAGGPVPRKRLDLTVLTTLCEAAPRGACLAKC